MIRGRFALVVLLGVVLTGCGNDGVDVNSGSSQPGAAVTAEALDGRSFVSTTVSGHELVAGSQVRLSFDGSQLRASGGCNSMSGPFAFDDRVLEVSEMASTMMGCEPDLMAQDEWLSGFLTSGPIADVADDTLTLGAGAVAVTLVDESVATPARPLLGTTWNLETITENETASSVPVGVQIPTLVFVEGGIEFYDGCNPGGSLVAIDGSTLRVSNMSYSRRICQGDEARVQHAVDAVLVDGDVTFAIEGDQLTLTRGDQGLVYRAT